MNETIIQLIIIFIFFAIVYIVMEIYFWNENRKWFNNAMRQIDLDRIKWDQKIETWKKRGDCV